MRSVTRAKADFQLSPNTAKILIVEQVFGTKAHQTELSFNDVSDDRLRQWLGYFDHQIFL